MKFLNLLFIPFILAGCSQRDENSTYSEEFQKYTGSYKIISYMSDLAVDLNNDKILPNELVDEIYILKNNQTFLDIIQNKSQNNIKLISMFLPKTHITYEYPSSPEGAVQDFSRYGFLSELEFNPDTFHLMKNKYIENGTIDNVEYNKTVLIDKQIKIINSKQLQAFVVKEYFDFNTKSWKALNIKIIFEKMY
ncbi:hypothetical protein HZQ92_17725 [Elizabethkingia anophelis]|nr:hypothetical protein [Elizabethkingia anophelis]MCT3824878.1 hypothetical protein [Elizabethkingia anophelis]MCT3932174.1 hypothetical protein [Elizabethkingia anophelis]MCT4113816.1 hypothetical protein [Elizabethkingia anophelis]